MALLFSEDGMGCALAEISGKDRRAVLMDRFVNDFATRVALRYPPDWGDFCPVRTTAVMIACLQQVARTLNLLKFRVTSLLKKARLLQAWFRRFLHAREHDIKQVLERWVATHANQKKVLKAELYRDSWLSPKTFRHRLQAYTRLHNPEDAMRAAVMELYWEKRRQFQREFRGWFVHHRALRQEEAHVLRQLQAPPPVSGACASPTARFGLSPGAPATALTGNVEYRLVTVRAELAQLMQQRPTFRFGVKTVSLSELMRRVSRPRPLLSFSETLATSEGHGSVTPTKLRSSSPPGSPTAADSGRSVTSSLPPQPTAEEEGEQDGAEVEEPEPREARPHEMR
eukprot:RCo005007